MFFKNKTNRDYFCVRSRDKIILMGVLMILFISNQCFSQTPTCANDGPGTVFISLRANGSANTQLETLSYGAGNANFSPLGAPWPSGEYNAIGYNPADHMIYGDTYGSSSLPLGTLIKIDPATGAVTTIGQITGFVASEGAGTINAAARSGFNAGAFDGAGNYWAASDGDTTIYQVNLTTLVATPLSLTDGSGKPASVSGADITWSNGYMWVISRGGSSGTAAVSRIDLTSGVVTTFTLPFSMGTGSYGAAWTYPNGDLAFMLNGTGAVYRISVANPSTAVPAFTLVATTAGPTSSANDGTICWGPPIDLSVVKTTTTPFVQPGGAITWNLVVKNNDPVNSSTGFVVNDALPAGLTNIATSTPGCSISGNHVQCDEGALGPGNTFSITITAHAPSPFSRPITNTATVTGNEQDNNLSNNSSSSVVNPEPVVSKSVDPSTPNPIGASANAVFDLTVTNPATDTTLPAGYAFYEVVPQNTTFTTITKGTTDCTLPAVSGTLCKITVMNPIAAGTPEVLQLTFLTADPLAAGTTQIFNVATQDTSIPPPGCTVSRSVCTTPPTNCPATGATCASVPTMTPNVSLSKSASTTTALPATAIAYTLTATNTTARTTQGAGYTFTEVVPAYTTFTSFAAVSPTTATVSGCAANAAAGTECTITITSAIVNGAPAQVMLTVTPMDPLPMGTTGVVNQVYYATPPVTCSLTGTPVCNPNPPTGCSGGTCTPPTSCTTDDPACVNTPVVEADMQANAPATMPATVGTPVTVTTMCTNAGPSTAANATCTVTGAPAGATTTCTPLVPATTLALGSSITCTTTFTPASATPVTLVTTAHSDTPDPNMANNVATTTVTIIVALGSAPESEPVAVPAVRWETVISIILLMTAVAYRRRWRVGKDGRSIE
jgi:uncharacterized repeat protein (TIGR01451 family)